MKKEEGTRLSLNDTLPDAVMKMAGGNLGAMSVGMALLQREVKIDPDSVMAPMASLMCMDMYHIYAENIWMLYKDVCREDLVKMVAILRAVQLGFIPVAILTHAIRNYGDGVDIDDLELQVKARLPRFGMKEELEVKNI